MNQKKWNKLNPERKIRRFRDRLLEAEKVLMDSNLSDEQEKIINNMLNWINIDSEIEISFSNDNLKDQFYIQRLLTRTEEYLKINQREHNLQIKTFDGKREIKKFPIKVFLNSLRSAFNVGSIIRSSEAFGVDEIILQGYTPGIENTKVRQTSMDTYKHIKISRCENGFEAISDLKRAGYKILAFELTNKSIPLNEFNISQPCVILMGNEALGLEKKYIEQADATLEIPLRGWKNSLNVASAFAIGIYDISTKLDSSIK
jgi:tRNA G18 (ribose-2'-O)-methylase SpoU